MSYLTLDEANALNADNNSWSAASDVQKQDAIDYGYRYLNNYYSCVEVDETDIDNVPADIKLANSMLAIEHLTEPLWDQRPSVDSVSSTAIDTGNGVKISKNYYGSQITVTDPFPDVTMTLSGYCSLRANQTVGSVPLARG